MLSCSDLIFFLGGRPSAAPPDSHQRRAAVNRIDTGTQAAAAVHPHRSQRALLAFKPHRGAQQQKRRFPRKGAFSPSAHKLALVRPPACHTAGGTGSARPPSMHRRLRKRQCQAWHLAAVVGYTRPVRGAHSGLTAPPRLPTRRTNP